MSMTLFTKSGEALEVEALVRKIQAGIITAGGKVETDENAILSAFAGFDAGEHVSDSMDNERLGEVLESFAEAWVKVAAEVPDGAKEKS